MNSVPLFIPLRREWFAAFAVGEKTEEWRRYGPRWNHRTCAPGRPVVLSLGYTRTRLAGRLVAFHVAPAEGPAAELFGAGTPCAVLTIDLDRTHPAR